MSLHYQSSGAEIQAHEFAYRRSADQDAAAPARHRIVVVGAGPVGLTLAIDLARRGQKVLLLDNDHRLSSGSRAICFAKRTLEIWDRLGVGEPMCSKGVGWSRGRVFLRGQELYHFELLAEPGHERPAFINLQQYYAEAYLAVHAAALPNLEIRWRNQVVALDAEGADGAVRLGIETPEGRYELAAEWLCACDGSRSPLRGLMGLETRGQVFRDRFLIADVRMQAPFPAERWFWFEPPFHTGQGTNGGPSAPSSVLLHRQPDDVWRIDFQLGWDADPELEKQPERIAPRIDAMMRAALGHTVPWSLEWASVYTFACQRMAAFRHGRVLFAGDSAHGVSPFGARGANSGVQDADNLSWKLDLVVRGCAPDALLDSYATEREFAADENILNSTRSTDFITPKSEVSRLFRDAALELARTLPFARRIVNSGRLSVPAVLDGSVLNTPDRDSFTPALRPGAPAVDAALHATGEPPRWLLRALRGEGFALLAFGGEAEAAAAARLAAEVAAALPGLPALQVLALPASGPVADRYDARVGTLYLLRPDQHVAARWRHASAADVVAAIELALARRATPEHA